MTWPDTSDFIDETLDVLSSSPLFFDFRFEELGEIIRGLELAVFEDGEALTQQGEPSTCCYILISGKVVTSFTGAGERRLEANQLEPPAVIGEIGLILNKPRSANNHAVGPVRAVRLSQKIFHDLMRQKPQFSLSICRLLASRLERTNRQISRLYVDPAATISNIDLEFLSASSGESTVYRTAKSILTTLPAEAFALYDLAQSLDAKTARDLWFSGDGKVYRLAADAIIIHLAARRSCAQAAERGEFGLIEACTPDGARLDEADYLWPKHPQLYPSYQLITRPLALQATDDIYTRVTGALRDTLAFDTATVIEHLGQLPADAPLRVVHDHYQLTNNFSVKFMNFKRFRQARETCPVDREADSAETGNNPLPSLIPGIDTGVRIMVRLVRLVFDKFEASLQRLPTAEEIGTVLVANLRQSHQLLTMLARVNLIEVNTRNYVLTGSTGHWYQPELFIYKHTTRGAAAPWSGDLATLHEYGLAPSPLAVQQFHQTTPRKEIVRAVGGHSQTDGCPARAPLNLASMAGELGLVHAGAVASEQAGKEDANAILAIFHHLLVPLAPYVYEVDRRQRLARVEAVQASQRQRAERAQRDPEQAQRVERIRREIVIENPGLSKKALERMVARRLAEQNLAAGQETNQSFPES